MVTPRWQGVTKQSGWARWSPPLVVLAVGLAGGLGASLLLAATGCHRRTLPEAPSPKTDVRIVEEEAFIVAVLPIEAGAPVEAGLAEGLRQAQEHHLIPAGDPLIVYEGAGRRSVAFPVAAPPDLQAPWRVLRVPGGERAVLAVHGGIEAAEVQNQAFVDGVRSLGREIVGPIFHRLLDDPRVADPSEVRVSILAVVE